MGAKRNEIKFNTPSIYGNWVAITEAGQYQNGKHLIRIRCPHGEFGHPHHEFRQGDRGWRHCLMFRIVATAEIPRGSSGSKTAIGQVATVATAISTLESGRSLEMVLASRYAWLEWVSIVLYTNQLSA